MQGNNPFNVNEVNNLTSLGCDPGHFKFGVLTFESDKYITIKEPTNDGSGNLITVEPTNNFKFNKRPNKAESAMMHPTQNIIALKARTEPGADKFVIQVWSMEPQKKLKDLNVNESINHWTWLNNNKLGIVTANAAYSINIYNENEDRKKILERDGPLRQGCQIIDLAIDIDEKYALLTAISSPDGGKSINGHMQLCLIEAQKSQILEGHRGRFGFSYHHSPEIKSTVFVYFERKAGENSQRLHINEIVNPPQGKQKLKQSVELQMPPQFPNDFPVFIHVSEKHGVIYVITKFGFFFVIEIASTQIIHRGKLSNEPIVVGTKNTRNDGVLAINRGGYLLSLNVNENNLYQFVQNSGINDANNVAMKLALNYKLPGCESVLVDKFQQLLQNNDFQGAARIAANSPGNSIRNKTTIEKIKSAPQGNGPKPILQYFQTLLQISKLNTLEALELCGPVLQQGKTDWVEDWLRQDKLECSGELAKLIKQFDKNLALKVLEKCDDPNLKVQALIEAGQFDKARELSGQSGIQLDWASTIQNLVDVNPEAALKTAMQAAKTGGNIYQMAEIFLKAGKIQELTGFLVENMKENKTEDAPW